MNKTAAILFYMLTATQAWSAVEFQSVSKKMSSGVEVASRIVVDGGNMLVQPGESAGGVEMIFRGDRQTMYAVQHPSREVLAFNKKAMEGLSAQMSAAMAQMKDAIASMPPEQRAMIEKLAGGPDSEKPAVEIKASGKTRAVHGITCKGFDLTTDGVLMQEIYACDWSEVEHGKAAFGAMKDLSRFFDDIASGLNSPVFKSLMTNPFEGMKAVDGFPLLMVRYKDGVAVEEITLSKPVPVADEVPSFEPPADYQIIMPGQDDDGGPMGAR